MIRAGAILVLVLLLSALLSCDRESPEKGKISGPFLHKPVEPTAQRVDIKNPPREFLAPRWQPGDPLYAPGDLEGLDKAYAHQSGGFRKWLCRLCRRLGLCRKPTPETPETDGKIDPYDSWDGIPATGILVPDPVGDIGPVHYIQAVNSAFQVFNRDGTEATPAQVLSHLWKDQGLPCECTQKNLDDRKCEKLPFDPIVRYDEQADRWLISFITSEKSIYDDYQCVAISKTGNPVTNDEWHLLAIDLVDPAITIGANDPPGSNKVPLDFTKIGVWTDSYFMSSRGGATAIDIWALDRMAMLSGQSFEPVRFRVTEDNIVLLPADADGTTPAADSPGLFARQIDAQRHDTADEDQVEIYEFAIDWSDPDLATFSLSTALPTDPFESELCGTDYWGACVPQPGTNPMLETLSLWPSWRLQFRKFPTHETMLFNHTVDANGSDLAGLRWYELRRPTNGTWSIHQQGTYFDESVNRFMGSISMDALGNIALGFAVSSETVFPGIRIVGRRPSDAPGSMPLQELHVMDGGGSQTGSFRYGNYSTMDVDPTDDCTFWYTQEYYAETSAGGWKTRIVSVRLPGCD